MSPKQSDLIESLRKCAEERGKLIKEFMKSDDARMLAIANDAVRLRLEAEGVAQRVGHENERLRGAILDYHEALSKALLAAKAKDCPSCGGHGVIMDEVDVPGMSTPHGGGPRTRLDEAECEDCAGIGKEWL